MSSSVFLELERRKLKMEWEKLPNPKPTWEDYKRLKLRITFKKKLFQNNHFACF